MSGKFQPSPPREQPFFDEDKKLSSAWVRWFGLIPPLLTSPVSSGAPASATAQGISGQIAFDANFVYVCVADSTWKRAAISSW